MTIVGETDNGKAALRLVEVLRPDVILMDIEMPEMDGLMATAALRRLAPDSAVVIISMHEDATMRARAQAAGAVAYVAKHLCGEQLPEKIRQAAACKALQRDRFKDGFES